MMATGIIATVALFVYRENCDAASDPTVCQGYTNSVHWAYPLIALGAICFIAAALSATSFQRRGRKNGSVGPTDEDDQEGVFD